MEKFLEPIELNDAELEAVAGGINTGSITNSSASVSFSASVSNSGTASNEGQVTAGFAVVSTS